MTTRAEKTRWRKVKRVLAILGMTDLVEPHPESKKGVQPKILMQLQEGGCYLCGEFMVHPGPPMVAQSPLARSREHVIPKARSGQNRRNVLLAHHGCNNAKGERLPYPCELIYLAAINARLEAL